MALRTLITIKSQITWLTSGLNPLFSRSCVLVWYVFKRSKERGSKPESKGSLSKPPGRGRAGGRPRRGECRAPPISQGSDPGHMAHTTYLHQRFSHITSGKAHPKTLKSAPDTEPHLPLPLPCCEQAQVQPLLKTLPTANQEDRHSASPSEKTGWATATLRPFDKA